MVSQTERSLAVLCPLCSVHRPLLPLFDHQHTKEFPIIFLNDVLVQSLRSIKPCYYSNTITWKNNLWESTFGRQSLRNWARMHRALVWYRVSGWRERRGVQSSALLRPAPYKGRRVRWGSVRPPLWAQSPVSSQAQTRSCEYFARSFSRLQTYFLILIT